MLGSNFANYASDQREQVRIPAWTYCKNRGCFLQKTTSKIGDFHGQIQPQLSVPAGPQKLQKNIALAIADYDHRKKRTVMSALEDKAKEFGFVLFELSFHVRGSSPKPRVRAGARYANPSPDAKPIA